MPTSIEWMRLKRQLIKERGHECEVCGYSLAIECDHIQPKAYGGSDEIENALLICPNCHHLKSRVFKQPRKRGGYGMPRNRQDCIDQIRSYIESVEHPDLHRMKNPAEDLISYENDDVIEGYMKSGLTPVVIKRVEPEQMKMELGY